MLRISYQDCILMSFAAFISAKYVLRFVFSVAMLAPAFFSLSLETPGDIKVLNILRPFPKSVTFSDSRASCMMHLC